jgi:hypothetical protein
MIIAAGSPLGRNVKRVIADGRDVTNDCRLVDTTYRATVCFERNSRGRAFRPTAMSQHVAERRRVHELLVVEFRDRPPIRLT